VPWRMSAADYLESLSSEPAAATVERLPETKWDPRLAAMMRERGLPPSRRRCSRSCSKICDEALRRRHRPDAHGELVTRQSRGRRQLPAVGATAGLSCRPEVSTIRIPRGQPPRSLQVSKFIANIGVMTGTRSDPGRRATHPMLRAVPDEVRNSRVGNPQTAQGGGADFAWTLEGLRAGLLSSM
jgi:hypothetical protein